MHIEKYLHADGQKGTRVVHADGQKGTRVVHADGHHMSDCTFFSVGSDNTIVLLVCSSN